MAAILPREAVGLIGGQMVRLANRPGSTLGAAFVGSTLASIWSANAGMKALFDGFERRLRRRPRSGLISKRVLITYSATLLIVVFLVVVVAMTVAAPIVMHTLWIALSCGCGGAPLRWLIVYVLRRRGLHLGLSLRVPAARTARWRWVYCGRRFRGP